MKNGKGKKKEGRPPIYNKGILKKVRVYLNSCADVIEEFHRTRGEKSDSYDRILKVNLPTIEGLAYYLGVSRKTIYLWEEEHVEFLHILEELRTKQANLLINNSLSGNYNPTIAKLLLTKHDYRDAQEHTGKDGAPLIPSSLEEMSNDQLEKLLQSRNI